MITNHLGFAQKSHYLLIGKVVQSPIMGKTVTGFVPDRGKDGLLMGPCFHLVMYSD